MSYSFLIEMGWKSALISAAALLLVTLLKSRSSADKVAILRLGVGLLLLLPVASLVGPQLQVETSAAVEAAPIILPAAPAVAEVPTFAVAVPASANPTILDNPGALLTSLYLTGLLLIALHLALGIFTLRRWTASAREISASEPWRSALVRTSVGSRLPRLLVSDRASSPLSWGWRRPVILLDEKSLERPEDADAILAHEVAHVVRSDWAALMASRVAVALFWFNPLVWLLARQVGQQAEEAADSEALAYVEPARYAQTLVSCAKYCSGARVPANSIAPSRSGLRRRVKLILEAGRGVPSGSRWTLFAMLGCIAFAAPVAALELVPAAAAKLPLARHFAPFPQAQTGTAVAAAAPAPAPLPVVEAPPITVTAAATSAPLAPLQVRPEAPTAGYHGLSDEEVEEIAAEARRAAEEAMAEAAIHTEQATAIAIRAAAEATKAAAIAVAAGADSMTKGADAMDRGARDMAAEAVKLRSADYRATKIAEAARRGDSVTHQELIDAIPELEEGSREMVKGARKMREAAAEMRRQRQN